MHKASLAPPSRHWYALLGLVLGLSVAVFVMLALNVEQSGALARDDRQWLLDIVGWRVGWLNGIFKVVTQFCSGLVTYGLLIVAALVLWRLRRDVRVGVACVAWLALGQLLRLAVNTAIARPRPPSFLHLVSAAGYAFPSGHTTNATIAYGLLAFIAVGYLPRLRWLLISLAVVMAVAVGLSRSYLGVHWPTDVLGGWSLGIAWLCLGAVTGLLVGLSQKRRERIT